MRVLITGATGRLGRQIVKDLRDSHELTLVSRTPTDAGRIYGDFNWIDFDTAIASIGSFDAVVHLATRNNDSRSDFETFFKDNVELSDCLARASADAGVTRFVFASTTHAIAPGKNDYYGMSKKRAEERLLSIPNLNLTILRFAAVRHDGKRGKLSAVRFFPAAIQTQLAMFLGSLRATTDVALVKSSIAEALADTKTQIKIITDRQLKNSYYHGIKRMIDLACAGLLLIGTGWLMILLAMVVWKSSGTPILFRQERVGTDQTSFVLYKFRTMRTDTPQKGTHEVPSDFVTPIGRLLRKTKLDELPQILNVVRGELSFVGPRPCLPNQIKLRHEREKKHIFKALPGLTGHAQMAGLDMSEPEKLAEKDGEYLALRSTLMDLKIMVKTVVGRARR